MVIFAGSWPASILLTTPLTLTQILLLLVILLKIHVGSNKFYGMFGYTHLFPCCHVVLVSCLWTTQPKMTD